MLTFLWITYFGAMCLYAVVGIYIYSRRSLRERVNMRQVWSLFWIFNFLKIFDILSTIYFTTRIGIEYEGNLLTRVLMEQFGIFGGLGLVTIFFIPFSFFFFLTFNYIFKNGKGWKVFKMIIITVSILVPLINVGSVPV